MYRNFYESVLKQTGGSWFDFEGLIRDIYVVLLKPGDTAVDAGAHKGDHTFQMAQAVAPNGQVIAIEVAPELVHHLMELRSTTYRHLSGVIDIRGIGLSDTHRTGSFFYVPEAPGLSSLRNRDALVGGRAVESQVTLAPLDDICRSAPGTIRFVKMDIEGSEFDALRGGKEILAEHRPVLVFEHDTQSPLYFSYSIQDLLDLLQELEYQVFDFFGNSYDQLEAWSNTMIWNFVAVPRRHSDTSVIFDTVRRTLSAIGVRY